MRILRHAVFSNPPDRPSGRARHHLLVLAEDGGVHFVSRWSCLVGRPFVRAFTHQIERPLEATELFEREAESIWADGPLSQIPPSAESILNRLAANGEGATAGRPAPRGAIPAMPSATKDTTWATFADAASDPATAVAFIPDHAERAFCAIDGGGRAQLVLLDDAGGVIEAVDRGDLPEADTLLPDRPWWDGEPPLRSTTFDGFIEDSASPSASVTDKHKTTPARNVDGLVYWILDLVRYRGANISHLPLAERLALRDQALAELEAADALPPRWRSVTHFSRPDERRSLARADIASAAAPLPTIVARDLGASYRSGAGALRATSLARASA